MVAVRQIVSSALRFLSHEWKDQIEIHQQIPEGQTVWETRIKSPRSC